MNLWLKIGMPIGLGFVAAIMNLAATASINTSYTCIRVTEDLPVGTELSEELIESVEINGDLGALPETFLPLPDH